MVIFPFFNAFNFTPVHKKLSTREMLLAITKAWPLSELFNETTLGAIEPIGSGQLESNYETDILEFFWYIG